MGEFPAQANTVYVIQDLDLLLDSRQVDIEYTPDEGESHGIHHLGAGQDVITPDLDTPQIEHPYYLYVAEDAPAQKPSPHRHRCGHHDQADPSFQVPETV
ncbi:hypothetical protein ES703_14935 [subsurface metagenome]